MFGSEERILIFPRCNNIEPYFPCGPTDRPTDDWCTVWLQQRGLSEPQWDFSSSSSPSTSCGEKDGEEGKKGMEGDTRQEGKGEKKTAEKGKGESGPIYQKRRKNDFLFFGKEK